jgi:hypothetical protein
MRTSTFGWMAGAALLLTAPGICAQEGGHVLAAKVEGFAQAPGTKITTETVTAIQAAKMTLLIQPPPRKSPGEPQKEPTLQEGTQSRIEVRKETMEVLSPTKARRILEESRSEGLIKIGGQDRPIPNAPSPLAKRPMIVEYKDGKYSVSLEAGEPDQVQAPLLVQFSKAYGGDNETAVYGTAPRKPGEKWDVDAKNVRMMGDAQDLTGSYTVEFVEVKEFQGTPCAVLKATFDLSGKTPNGKMSFKGSSTVMRSLADKIDLEVKVDATMMMDNQTKPEVNVHVEGPFSSLQKTTLEKP